MRGGECVQGICVGMSRGEDICGGGGFICIACLAVSHN